MKESNTSYSGIQLLNIDKLDKRNIRKGLTTYIFTQRLENQISYYVDFEMKFLGR
jgi:hypothetical protein